MFHRRIMSVVGLMTAVPTAVIGGLQARAATIPRPDGHAVGELIGRRVFNKAQTCSTGTAGA